MKMENLTYQELLEVICSLPEVRSVKVPIEPTGFCTGHTIIQTENNPTWKIQIIDIVDMIMIKSEDANKPIIKINFRGYYGEEPKEGNKYYIQMLNADGIHTGKMLSSGEYGSLD